MRSLIYCTLYIIYDIDKLLYITHGQPEKDGARHGEKALSFMPSLDALSILLTLPPVHQPEISLESL